MGADPGGAVLPGLPGAPPVTREVEAVGHLPGELIHGDAKGVGQGDGGGEDGLLVPRFVAGELSKTDASFLRQLGLGEAEGPSSKSGSVNKRSPAGMAGLRCFREMPLAK